LRKNSKIENHITQYWAGFRPKAMAPRAGGHLGASHASGCATLVHRAGLPCPWLTWWHGGRRRLGGPRGDEVDDTSNRGSRGGRRARGGGSGAYRAAAQREVGWRQLIGANPAAVHSDLVGRVRRRCEAKGSAQRLWEPGRKKMGERGVDAARAKGRRERVRYGGQVEEEQGAWRGDKGAAPSQQLPDTVGRAPFGEAGTSGGGGSGTERRRWCVGHGGFWLLDRLGEKGMGQAQEE
jgi:hypothetical protein